MKFKLFMLLLVFIQFILFCIQYYTNATDRQIMFAIANLISTIGFAIIVLIETN